MNCMFDYKNCRRRKMRVNRAAIVVVVVAAVVVAVVVLCTMLSRGDMNGKRVGSCYDLSWSPRRGKCHLRISVLESS